MTILEPMSPTLTSQAAIMLIGDKYPEAAVGLARTPAELTKAVVVGETGAVLIGLLPYRWGFATEDDPEKPADALVMVTAGSLRAAIIGGDSAQGLLRVDRLEPANVPNEDLYDFRSASMPMGLQLSSLRRRQLGKFLARCQIVRSAQRVRIESSFHLEDPDALEFVRLGVFTGDTELAFCRFKRGHQMPPEFQAPESYLGLMGEATIIAWPAP